MSNRKTGTDFEREFCKLLADDGYWVHNFGQKISGQPADVIAVKGKQAYLIDCKVCADGRFVLSRLEENQRFAMALWAAKGNGTGWFAVHINDTVYMVSLNQLLQREEEGHKSVTEPDLKLIGHTLQNWLNIWRYL